MFFLGTTAMHVTFHKKPVENDNCVSITVSPEDYLTLVRYIESSFEKKPDGDYILINNASYGNNHCFFEATGTYNLFFTCNTWTNTALKRSNLKACLWTPFEKWILKKYKD